MSLSKEKKIFFLRSEESTQLFFTTLGRVFLICAIFCIFYGAYFVAEQTFSNQPYNAQSHKIVSIVVRENESDEDVATELVSKKLIYGKRRFVIRKYFSKYKGKSFISGKYEFRQSQGMDDIMGILCGDHVSEEIIQ